MKRTAAGFMSVTAIGVMLVASQGCGTKWLQSEGDDQAGKSGTEAAGNKPGYPDISRSGLNGESESGLNNELSGFSHNPTEERLAQSQSGFPSSLSPSDNSGRRRVELTKEEKAAMEAGLQDVFFGYDQWMVSNEGMEALDRDAQYLKDHPGAVLKIEGHCDERGTTDYNLVLGDKRAKAARTYLIEAGVRPKQVAILSFGKERPFCFDHDESCYQQNRRGHMLLHIKK